MADPTSRAGAQYTTPEILEWVERVHAPHDEALSAAFEAPEREGIPPIQVGVSEGKLLELLIRLAGCRTVVEVGTLAGYSAIRIARALPADGHLHTVEVSEAHAALARSHLRQAGLEARATVHVGRGVDVLPTLEHLGPFCAVFLDADKASYATYGAWAARNVRKGGLLLGDNAFLFGRLLEESDEAAAMRKFHEDAALAFDSVCVPTPDGLVLGIRR